MNNFEKIKALHLEKRKSFQILLAVELFILIVGIVGLFGKKAVYEYGVGEISGHAGSFFVDSDAAVMNSGAEGEIRFTGIVLPRGTYRVQLYYSTDTDFINMCTAADDGLAQGMLRTNGANLFSGLNHTDFDMWLLRNSGNLTVSAGYAGVGTLAVSSLRIVQNNSWNRMILFYLLCLAAAVNVIYCYVVYDRAYRISVKNKSVTFCLALITLAASLPLTVDYIVGSGDLVYHLMRVEGIRDGLLSGQFPIRISPEWLQGYGYASPIFYGELFLYLEAIFRIIGFSVTASYHMFMFLITVASVLIAYYSFKKIFGEAYIGVFCSALYVLSIYRIYRTHITSSWGECFGMMLLPLILYGFWIIFTGDVREKSYRNAWIPLAVGFALTFQSHLLSCEIAGVFSLILCVVQWRKVFRKETFLVLVKAAVAGVLLSGWFMVPFLDYMITGDFVIHHVSDRTIQYRGLLIPHLFFTYFLDGGNVFYGTSGMFHSAATGIGIVFIAALVILAALFFTGRNRALKPEEQRLGIIAGALSMLAMVMSLNLFPWDHIQKLGSVAASLISSLQTPARLLIIPTVGLTAVAGVVMKYMMNCSRPKAGRLYAAGSIFLLAIGSIYMQDGMLNNMSPIRVYNSEGLGTGYISGEEYLPYGVDADRLLYHNPYVAGELQVSDYRKLSLGANADVTNPGGQKAEIVFPLLYYKGYRAYGQTDEALKCYAGDNAQVTVEIPAGYSGEIRVRFISPWYWRVGEAVTCVTIMALLLLLWKRRRRVGEVQ